jgi:acyl-homoserine-lactone acylase
MMAWQVTARRIPSGLRIASLGLALWAAAPTPAAAAGPDGVEIRRTADGVPHILAGDWRGLGYGYGYAQAEDALCTLAEAFVTFEGRRSYFFGPEARPRADSTFGRPRNLDLDFFFRAFADAAVIAEYRRRQPEGLNDLIDGFAAGYNRYLREIRAARHPRAARACLGEGWVREIAGEDILRRMVAAGLAAGYAKFVPELVNAAPPDGRTAESGPPAPDSRQRLAAALGGQPGLGSNMLAFGGRATGGTGAVLFGNPHWFWSGPDRFYQAHLTIPGRVNVAGVSFLGIPVIMIGFNERVAWSHTVSEARRFGLFELALAAGNRTAYRLGGGAEAMAALPLAVEARNPGGATVRVARTLYRTRFGPVVDLGAQADALRWSAGRAVAIRDVNADNFRVFRTFFYWNQARSLDEFVAVQKREAGIPWANTTAIARGDGRVWYGDVGAVPDVPDRLREDCATALGRAFAGIDPRVPFLDGSRAECDWRADPRAVQRGAMAADGQPGLFREDYVANMNDSYWLSSPRQPLEGYPRNLGGEREALSLRGRLGHRLAQDLLAGAPLAAPELSRRLRRQVLEPRAYSAELFKVRVLDRVCPAGAVAVARDPLTGTSLAPPRRVNLSPACRVLRRWNDRGDVRDRGAHLWDAFWSRVARIPPSELFRLPFSPERPLDTPGDLDADDPRVAEALGAAVLAVEASGLALDAPRGAYLGVGAGGSRVPLYGGCEEAGYFTVACRGRDGQGFLGNTYLQVVGFGSEGVEAHTLLAHGQDEAALDGGRGNGALRRYAEKRWLRFPFREEDIRRERGLRRVVLRP